MTKSRKSLLLSELMLLVPLSLMLVLTLVVTSVTHAQDTTFTNGGKTVETDKIKATFENPAKALAPDRNAANTSTTLMYQGIGGGVGQIVGVRILDGDIALDQSSLDFYAGTATNQGYTLISRRDGNYNGHLSTFSKGYLTNPDGTQTIRRTWHILVTSREVIILMQSNLSTNETASDIWDKFTDSLVVK